MCPHPQVPSGKTEFGTYGTARQGRAACRSSCRHFITGKGLTQLATPLSKAEQGQPVFHFQTAPDENSHVFCSLCDLRESRALLPARALLICAPRLPVSLRDSGQVPQGSGRGPAGRCPARCPAPCACGGNKHEVLSKAEFFFRKHAADSERIPTSPPNPAAACLGNKTPCGF